jgi:hypothetical protein
MSGVYRYLHLLLHWWVLLLCLYLLCLLLLCLLLRAVSHGTIPPPLFEKLRPCSAQRASMTALIPVGVGRVLLM